MTEAGPRPAPGWRRDLVVALVAGGVLFAVSLVPYLVAHANAPGSTEFNGFFFIADDASTYVSKMRQGADGAWGWSDPYISRPLANPVLLFLFYIAWGKVAALLHVSMYVGYHLARLSGAVALVGASRVLARECLPAGRARRVAVILAVGGSGVGWTLQLLGALLGIQALAGQKLDALELHLPELSGFYSIMAIPHFAWAAALMALALVGLVRAADGRGHPLQSGALATAAMLGLTLIHPQMLFVLAPLAGAYLLGMRRPIGAYARVAVPFGLCLPLLLYLVRVLTSDGVVVAWSREWRHQAPDLLGFVFALGLPLGLSLVAARHWRQASPGLRLMGAWVVLVFVLLYLPNPVNIQRRLVDGIYLPVAMLAAAGLEVVIQHRRARRRGFLRAPGPLTVLVVAISVLMSVLVWTAGLRAGLGRDPIIFVDRRELAAIDWLSTHRGAGTPPAVLSHPETGLLIPARSGDRVYVGHYSETIGYLRKARVAFEAYRGGAGAVVALARAEGATFIFYGPLEQAIPGGGLPAGDIPGAHAVYDRDAVRIYRLN
ncbi:MAG: hypothetical protein NVS3B24_18430 [Candidatus Dormibacteria bacterium]